MRISIDLNLPAVALSGSLRCTVAWLNVSAPTGVAGLRSIGTRTQPRLNK